MSPSPAKRIALVLGGGGLKGLAHIGVLRALEEREIVPSVVAGTSIGSLIGAAYATGMALEDMESRALALRRSDLFRLNRLGMIRYRREAKSIYQAEPLRELCASILPPLRIDDLPLPVLINTVDLQMGTRVVWGLPGLRDVPLVDAVYASCALPGFYPPGEVGGRTCADGGVIDNLPVGITSLGMDAVIAVDVGTSDVPRRADVISAGFATIYMRAATTMMHALQLAPLTRWEGPPMLLLRPRISHFGWFNFARTAELIEAGYHAAREALEAYEDCLTQAGGVFPKRPVRITVDPAKCISCGLCVALAPWTMALGPDGKAFAPVPLVEWSPADGDFVRHCPTLAISAVPIDAAAAPSSETSQADVVQAG